ncbi:MAG: DUF4386 domain-containing protein [Caldilineaceae bacterium]|nr:DUF4386 domain-containing protein [Caldilineaceae bacterium]
MRQPHRAGRYAATARAITASESLTRLGIAGDRQSPIAADIALALVYILFRPVSHALTIGRLLSPGAGRHPGHQPAPTSCRCSSCSAAPFYLAVFGADQLAAQALFYTEAHGMGYSLGLVFFGLNCLVFGYLVAKSRYVPRILGFLLIFAGAGYLVDCFAGFLLPDVYAAYADLFALVVFLPAIVGELALCLWLLIKGVNVPQAPRTTATLHPARAAA